MIIVESRLSSRALGRGLEMPLLVSIGRVLVVVLGRLRRRCASSTWRAGASSARSSPAAARPGLFLLEFAIGVILPMVLLALPAVRATPGGSTGRRSWW